MKGDEARLDANEDAEVDVRGDKEGYDPKWTHWRNNKGGASVQEYKSIRVVWCEGTHMWLALP